MLKFTGSLKISGCKSLSHRSVIIAAMAVGQTKIYNLLESQDILSTIKTKQCFVIGGGKTYYKFASFLTHLYITPHPYIFGEGIRLFDVSGMCELKLKFLQLIEVDNKNGIFQYQYQVLNN